MRSGWRHAARIGLACLLLLPAGASVALADASTERYALTRAQDTLVRLDSATGRVWISPLSGDGGWLPLGTPPPTTGAATGAGRFVLRILQPSGPSRSRPAARDAGMLFLGDLATGRAWLAEPVQGGEWSEIRGDAPQAAGG